MQRAKRFSIILAVTVIAGSLVSPACAGQVNMASDFLVELGKRFYDRGDRAEAVHEFSKALIVDPDNKSALKYLDKMGLKGGIYGKGTTSATQVTDLSARLRALEDQNARYDKAVGLLVNEREFLNDTVVRREIQMIRAGDTIESVKKLIGNPYQLQAKDELLAKRMDRIIELKDELARKEREVVTEANQNNAELAKLKSELAAREGAIDRLENTLDAQRNVSYKRGDTGAEQKEKIWEMKKQLSRAKHEVYQKENYLKHQLALLEKDRNIWKKKAAAKANTKELKSLETKLEASISEIDELNKRFGSEKADLSDKENQLALREKTISEKENELALRDKTIADLRSEIDILGKKMSERDTLLKDKSMDIIDLTKQLSDAKSEMVTKTGEMKGLEQKWGQETKKLTKLQDAEEKLKGVEVKMDNLLAQLSDRDKSLLEKDRSIAGLQGEMARLSEQVQLLEDSLSLSGESAEAQAPLAVAGYDERTSEILKDKDATILGLKQELALLSQMALNDKSPDIAALKKQIVEAKSKIRSQNDLILEKKNEIKTLQGHVAEIEGRLKAAQKKIQQKELLVKSLETKVQQLQNKK